MKKPRIQTWINSTKISRFCVRNMVLTTGKWNIAYASSYPSYSPLGEVQIKLIVKTRKSGVMTLQVPPHGTFVINKQPPNQQIWISSPLSGPARFGYSPEGVWVHHRKEGISLGALLKTELRSLIEAAGTGWDGVGLR